MWQLVMYAAFAIALILRRKFDLFLELLKKARGSTGSKPLKGAPHPLLRGACLLAAAMIITLVLHPKPVEGPLFGSKFSESIAVAVSNSPSPINTAMTFSGCPKHTPYALANEYPSSPPSVITPGVYGLAWLGNPSGHEKFLHI